MNQELKQIFDKLNNMYDFDDTVWLDIVNKQDPKMLYAPHIDEKGCFFNPWLEMDMRSNIIRKLASYLKMKTLKIPKGADWEPLHDIHYSYKKTNNDITFLGHSSFAISMDSNLIFTDPFFSNFAILLKKSRNITIDYKSLPENPVVLISHNHYDHLDKSSVKSLIELNATFIVPLKLKKYFLRLGARTVYELDWWDSITINNIKYTFLPAQHWSIRIGQPENKTLWGSFMIQGSKNIYFSGDTGYFVGFKEFGKVFYPIDYALLAVGASNPRWQRFYQHQNVDDFFIASQDLKAKIAIPMHYGMIKLGKESIDFPGYETKIKVDSNKTINSVIKILKICETLRIE